MRVLTVAGLIAGLLAVPSAPADAKVRPVPYAYETGAAAAMPYLEFGRRELPTYAGFTRVRLWRGEHAPWSAEPELPAQGCEAFGAGAWLGEEIEGHILDDMAPEDMYEEEGGVRNPTVSRSVYPAPDPRLYERWPSEPGVSNYRPPGQTLVPLPADGPLPRWQADCRGRTSGRGVSRVLDLPGVGVFGSVTEARVDGTTGAYVATTRSYASEIKGIEGELSSFSSLMRVRAEPGTDPVVDFVVAVSGVGPRDTAPGEGGLTLGAVNVPADRLPKEFDRALAEQAERLAWSLGSVGMRLIAPEATSDHRGGFSILAPVLVVDATLTAREDKIGGHEGLRLGVSWFKREAGAQY